MELPPTAASRVCGLLSGLDLLSLSHASGFWLRTLDQSPVWESRLPPQPSPLHAAGYKAVYLRSRALGFAGNRRSDISRSDTSYALLHQVSGEKLQLSGLRDASYSFDVCFALLPEEPDNCYIGGVLYGLQSQQAESRVWPRFHQQFVLVSSARDLYCSVIDHRPVVKSDLQLKKWYHVALTYDHRNRRQEVYVDGVKVRSDSGELHHEMEFLTHEQVGTGCITANGLDFPKPEYLGWYGFHGLVDDFRVWDGVLSEQEVGRLSTGKGGGERSLLGSLKGSGRLPRRLRWNVCEIQCTRPVETRQLEM
ncbi:unnamed protein product [Phytophthora lilii]|uniref:Unnamed protein product n=1 Tax=Phytophthora lilii TaxID=2077276 RepID=A0A9W6WLL7_9STRA|nr:unnamed protein product [Phytophthora lilii]